jgi:hypothetical protein
MRAVTLAAGTVRTLAGIAPPVGAGCHQERLRGQRTDAQAGRFNQPRALALAAVGGIRVAVRRRLLHLRGAQGGGRHGFTKHLAGIPAPGRAARAGSTARPARAPPGARGLLPPTTAANVYVADVVVAGASTRIRRIEPDGAIDTLHTTALRGERAAPGGSTLLAPATGTSTP